jgi:hypothetical protein
MAVCLHSYSPAAAVLVFDLFLTQTEDANRVTRLSDAELIAQLSDMTKPLSVEINLNYSFAQHPDESE